MEMNKKAWALPTVCKMQARIDPTPDYQRPPVWSRKQKQLLMDTILRNYDIPKFYWRSVKRSDGIQYEVIDGQQRLRAIWEFAADGYPLAKDIDPVKGFNVSGSVFSQLPPEVMEVFDTYSLDVVVVTDAQEDAQEDEVRDMFLRLQNGTTLKAQEKRNAMGGAMRDFVKDIASHTFFENCKFTNARFTYDHVASQCILIELKGGPANVKDSDLNKMYSENVSFDSKGNVAKKVKRTFDFLLQAFPEKTPELERYNAINLYCIASTLIDGYVWKDLAKTLANWFIAFETMRRANEEGPEEDRDPSLIEYRRLTSQSTDAEESIKMRVEILERRFFLEYPNIEPIDPIRGFSYEQRLAIFRRDQAICTLRIKCEGAKVSWDNWHADHVLPHSKGGKTTVANGKLACPACNLSKGANL
jgi:Protein of unknown function DUF262/HNH endonuclease